MSLTNKFSKHLCIEFWTTISNIVDMKKIELLDKFSQKDLFCKILVMRSLIKIT
jgi:hypothetical protein